MCHIFGQKKIKISLSQNNGKKKYREVMEQLMIQNMVEAV